MSKVLREFQQLQVHQANKEKHIERLKGALAEKEAQLLALLGGGDDMKKAKRLLKDLTIKARALEQEISKDIQTYKEQYHGKVDTESD